MKEIKKRPSMQIYPPEEPLTYPLTVAQVSAIFDTHKSTLYRWEKDGLIPAPKRNVLANLQESREYREEHLLAIIKLMQQRVKSSLRQIAAAGDLDNMDSTDSSWGWLELLKVNPEGVTKETTLHLPTGYTLRFNPPRR